MHALPIASIGLRLSDETVRPAVAQRLGGNACEPHICTRGKPVDAGDCVYLPAVEICKVLALRKLYKILVISSISLHYN